MNEQQHIEAQTAEQRRAYRQEQARKHQEYRTRLLFLKEQFMEQFDKIEFLTEEQPSLPFEYMDAGSEVSVAYEYMLYVHSVYVPELEAMNQALHTLRQLEQLLLSESKERLLSFLTPGTRSELDKHYSHNNTLLPKQQEKS